MELARPVSECEPQHALQGSVRPVPVAEGVAGGGGEFAEVLRAGEVHRGIGGIQPASLREEIVGVHAHRDLVLFLVRPGLGDGVLRPPYPAGARDPVARISLSEMRPDKRTR